MSCARIFCSKLCLHVFLLNSLQACFGKSPNFECPSHTYVGVREVPLSVMPRVTIWSHWISTNLVCRLFSLRLIQLVGECRHCPVIMVIIIMVIVIVVIMVIIMVIVIVVIKAN